MGILNRLQGWMQWLTSDPAGFILYLLYFAVSVLLTLTLHEIAHGYVAWKCGDPTAKMLGRLSLDPRRHLDPLGTLCLIFLGSDGPNPCRSIPQLSELPPRRFSGQHSGHHGEPDAVSAVVGLGGGLQQPFVEAGGNQLLRSEGIAFLRWNRLCGTPGGAGADNVDAMRYPWVQYIQRFLLMFSTMNLCVGIFNLLPIPPLDGFHILNDVVLRGRLTLNQNMFQIMQVVLIALCLTGALTGILSSVTGAVEDAVLNLMLAIAGRG